MAELYINIGPSNGKLFTLPDIPEITIGRGSSNVIKLLDESVSRQHAKIVKNGNSYTITDLNSRNGTRVNGSAVKQRMLHSGDEILIGRVALIFVNLDTSSIRGGTDVAGSIVEDGFTTIDLALEDRGMEFRCDDEGDSRIDIAYERGTDILRFSEGETQGFELMTFYDIIAHVNSIVELPAMLDYVLDRLMELFEADRGTVMLIKEDGGQELETIAAHSNESVPRPIKVSSVIANSALEGKAVLSNLNKRITPSAGDVKEIYKQENRIAMCVPVKGRDRILGVIYLDARQGVGRNFSEKGLSFLRSVSNGCAAAIENARLFQWTQRLRSRLESLINYAGDAIITVCDKLCINSWNKASEEIFGYKRDEIVGENLQVLFAEDNYKDLNLIRSQITSKEPLKNFETTMVKKDGKRIKVNLTMTENPPPELERGDGSLEFVCIIRDVSLIYEYQKQLIQAEKLASIGRTVAGIAHHINSPLGSVVGRTEMLLKSVYEISPSFLSSQLRAIGEDSKRVSSIISWLLNFSRPSERPPEEVNIKLVLNNVIRMLNDYITERKADVIVEIGDQDEPIWVSGCTSDFEQVFENILRNSLEAVGEGQKIFVSVHLKEKGRKEGKIGSNIRVIEVDVKDEGRGIAEDKLDYVWEPFFTTKGIEGKGLGLFITRNIVEKYGGNIKIESQEGVGTTVSIVLPIMADFDARKSQEEQIEVAEC